MEDDTLDTADLAHRLVNGACAIAAFAAFHSTEAVGGPFFASALSMYVFTYEALHPTKNHGLSAVSNFVGAFTFFSNPLASTVHAYNFVQSTVYKFEEDLDELRSSYLQYD